MGIQLKEALKIVDIAEFYGSTNDGSTNIIEGYDSDDELEFFLDTRGFGRIEHRDEYVAGEWLTPQGATAPDSVTVTIGGIPYRMYSFDGGATEETVTNSFEINHDVDCASCNEEATAIEWHVHFMPSTTGSGTVKWFLDYCHIANNGVAVAQTTLEATCAVDNQQYTHFICGTTLPVPAVGWSIGDIILFRLRRTPNNDGDTYGADALLLKTALHVPVNSRGSRQRYIK